MYRDKKILAVIPARGGSKRIPNKNIVPLAGRAMIGWTIGEAQSSDYIDTVIVSTDSAEIRKVALEFDAKVPFMREQASDDYTPVSEATLAALLQAEEYFGRYDVVVQLMANCPLRGVDDIDRGLRQFIDGSHESQISFFKFGWMNPWWAHTVRDGIATAVFSDVGQKRSQDLEDLFCPSGAIWIAYTSVLKEYKTFYSPGYNVQKIDWISALDIDDYEDLKMAEVLFAARGYSG